MHSAQYWRDFYEDFQQSEVIPDIKNDVSDVFAALVVDCVAAI